MTDQLRDRLQTTLGSQFTVERELSGGGMSRVFVALDEALGRPVAVKVLAPELAEGLSAERFTREIRLIARLQHPNVVPLLSAGTGPGGLPYYTMPFIDGESLRGRLAAGALPLAEATSILRDVARALAYAQTQGIVHRDVKPENVLLASGAAVVTDFGIAKALSVAGSTAAMTQVGLAVGTPAYMAPEQASGDPVDERTDVYAWGLIAWETLAGAHPFAGKSNAQQLIAAQLNETPGQLREKRLDVPPALASLVMRCLSKDPAARPRSAAELVAELDGGATSGAGISARGTGSRRRNGLIAAAAVLMLAVGVAAWQARLRGAPTITTAAAAPRIAVLPFENLGGADDEVFAAGITDEITGRLADIRALRVVSRTSARRFARRDVAIAEVGRALNADYVLEGTVRTERIPGKPGIVRVTPQLIRVADDVNVWQKALDATLTPGDVFRIQAEIATAVASAMNVALLATERERVGRVATRDSAAWRLYQLGRFQWEKRSPESLVLAQQHFRAAIARDSLFAAAYAGLGDAMFVNVLLSSSYSEFRARADEAIAALRRAVAIDSTLAEGWAGLGYALTLGRFDRLGADSAFRRSIALDPGYAPARYWYSQLWRLHDNIPAAESEAREAVALDPLSAVAHIVLGNAYSSQGKRDAALAEYERAVELQPGYPQAHLYLAVEYGIRGQSARATAAARHFLTPFMPAPVADSLASAMPRVLTGDGDPIQLAAQLTTWLRVGHHEIAAMVYGTRGMRDSAFARLNAAVGERSGLVLPTLGYLRPSLSADPRWKVLMARLQEPR